MADQLTSKKCFVTGGAGFIGSYLVESLPGDQTRVYMSVEKMRKLGWSAKLSSDGGTALFGKSMMIACVV